MKSSVILIFVLSVSFPLALAGKSKTRYDGYKVYHVLPKTDQHVKILEELEQSKMGVEFWEESNFVGKNADIMLAPHLQGDLIDGLKEQGLEVTEFISNVQKLIDEEVVNETPHTRISFTAYNRYSVIQGFLAEQAALYPHARVVQIGKTFENRDISGIIISKGQNKPIVFVEAGIHAREWIAGAVATYLINELLNSNDPIIQKWTEDYEWHIVPIANPDGYEFTFGGNRLWRKTRSTVSGSTCRGADPNRNWGFKWGTGGSSANPCDDTYKGRSAFSEPETRALSNYIAPLASRLVFYLDLHSYSQFILLPYGVNHPLPEYNSWMAIGNRAKTALARRYGTNFIVGNIIDLLYTASGGSVDWVKGTYNNVKLALCYELRDKGTYGFILPANQIVPSGLEFMDSLKSLMVDLAAL
jgi:murein tripeptide amidase MpaA